MSKDTPIGSIVWQDLTIKNADSVRDFYSEVVGWQMTPHNMGDYNDYDIRPDGGDSEPIAGICHAQGSNADVPPQWLVYVKVADVAASAASCVALGGTVVTGPRKMGANDFCVIQDPAGAMLALIS